MSPKDFYTLNGRIKTEEICLKSGTTWSYFDQFVRGKRRPSVELAIKLVKASANELDFVSLMNCKEAA
jgi:hypothetical protein